MSTFQGPLHAGFLNFLILSTIHISSYFFAQMAKCHKSSYSCDKLIIILQCIYMRRLWTKMSTQSVQRKENVAIKTSTFVLCQIIIINRFSLVWIRGNEQLIDFAKLIEHPVPRPHTHPIIIIITLDRSTICEL